MSLLRLCVSALCGALALALTTIIYPAARANPEWFMYLCWLLATVAFHVGMPLVFGPAEAEEAVVDIENVFAFEEVTQ